MRAGAFHRVGRGYATRVQVSGHTPPGALRSDDIRDLAELFDTPGPFVTVVMATEAAVPQAAQRSLTRWQTVRDEAMRRGAPERALAAIDALVADAHLAGEALVAVAAGDGSVRFDHTHEAPRRELVRVGALPSLGPLLEGRQARVRHLLVRTDRTGADLVVVGAKGGTASDGDIVVEQAGGNDGPVRKVAPGGWSQRRYQMRAENTWRDNAADVAERIVGLVDEHDLALVVAAGDVRAVEMLQKSLPARVGERLHVVDGGRNGGGTIDDDTTAVRHLVASVVAERTVGLLRAFEEEVGQADRAVNGPADTLGALARAQVDVLLVHDDPDDDRVAFAGDDPLAAALRAEDLRDLGTDGVREARLVDVLLRAAFASGAGVRMVPHAGRLVGGVGALLRWS
jgi:hypothetical protein